MPMLLTPEQLDEVKRVIQKHHAALILKLIGPEALTDGEADSIDEAKAEEILDSIKNSYLYGQAVAAGKLGPDTTFPEFLEWVKKNPTTLSQPEEFAVSAAQQHAGAHIRHLGAKIQQQFDMAVFSEDAQFRADALRQVVRPKTMENIARRESIGALKFELGRRLEDWERDWNRVAVTEKVNAMNRGVADTYRKTSGDPWVFRRPQPDACKHCFIEGTMVETRSGLKAIETIEVGDEVLTHKLRWRRVTEVIQNDYEGPIYGFNGQAPHATANHPYLVDLDWKRADAIQKGDHVIGLVQALDANDQPPSVTEQALLQGVPPPSRSRVVPGPTVQLYHHLQARDANVDVVYVDSHLRNGREVLEGLGQGEAFWSRRRERSLPGEGFLPLSFWSPRLRSSLSRVLGQVSKFFWTHSLDLRSLALASGRASNTQVVQTTFDDSPGHPEMLRDAGHRMSSRFQHLDHEGFIDVGFGLNHAPYAIRVRNIDKDFFAGTVYNLEVEEDESYFANGLAVHNCLRLHLGPDGHPRLFRLSTLESNGSNVGKKASEWRSTISPIHPHCQCSVERMPEGWGFDEDSDLVPAGKFGIKYDSEGAAQKAFEMEDQLQKSFRIKDRINFQGLPIAIEQRIGDVRTWTDPSGYEGRTRMLAAYGYVEGSLGPDGDEYDVYVGPDPTAPMVYIVHQNDPSTGDYDEPKSMLGFPSEDMARAAYLVHYDRDEFLGHMEMLPIEEFRQRVFQTRKPGNMVWESRVQKAVLLHPNPNRGLGDPELLAYPLEAPSGFAKGECFVQTPASLTLAPVRKSGVRGRPPSRFEGSNDTALADAQPVRYVLNAHALVEEPSRFVDVVAPGTDLQLMDAGVLSKSGYLQIVDGVVEPVSVLMVDNFAALQGASEVFLHDHPMLKALLPVDIDQPVLCLPTKAAFVSHGEPDYNLEIRRGKLQKAEVAPGLTGRAADGIMADGMVKAQTAPDPASYSVVGNRGVMQGTSGAQLYIGIPQPFEHLQSTKPRVQVTPDELAGTEVRKEQREDRQFVVRKPVEVYRRIPGVDIAENVYPYDPARGPAQELGLRQIAQIPENRKFLEEEMNRRVSRTAPNVVDPERQDREHPFVLPGDYSDRLHERLVISFGLSEDEIEAAGFTNLTKAVPFVGPRGGLWADPKHTIPWKAREGVVKVDNAMVHETVDAILDQVEASGQHQMLKMDDIAGKGTEVKVGRKKVPVKVETGKAFEAEVNFPKKGKTTITLKVPKGIRQDRKSTAQALRNTLAHELTHVKDPSVQAARKKGSLRSTGIAEQGSFEAYINEPTEVAAHMQEVFRDLHDHQAAQKAKQAANPIVWALSNSRTWRDIREALTPQNRQKAMKLIAGWWENHKVGVGQSFEKAGPFIGPRGGKWADPKHTIPWKEKQPIPQTSDKVEWKDGYPEGFPEPKFSREAWNPENFGKRGGTEQVHWDHDEVDWKPERKALHASIIDQTFAKANPPPTDRAPIAIVSMGGPGSGKTTIMRALGLGTNSVMVNSDDVKEKLPEFRQFVEEGYKTAASATHHESHAVMVQVLTRAMDEKRDLVYDRTGADRSDFIQEVLSLKEAGYRVKVVMPYVDADEAVARAEKRGQQTGRFVPENLIRSISRKVPANFAPVAAVADEAVLMDNTGKKPRTIFYKTSSGAGVLEEEDLADEFPGLEHLVSQKVQKAMNMGDDMVQKIIKLNTRVQGWLDKQPARFKPGEGLLVEVLSDGKNRYVLEEDD